MNQFKRIRNRYKNPSYTYYMQAGIHWLRFKNSLGLVPLSEYTGTLSPLSGERGSYQGIRFICMDLGNGDDVTSVRRYVNGEITDDVAIMAANREALEDAFTKAVVTGLGVAILKPDEGAEWDAALR